MPCFRPLKGYRSRFVNEKTGKRAIVFNLREAYSDFQISIPCGQCRFCRLEHSRQYAMRCVHEASLYLLNCFLTLTYSDQFLPPSGSLDYNAPVLFMKRLRERYGAGIRSFGCAEYGELLNRPHYHLCIFNFDFPDKKLFGRSGENSLYRSSSLEELWPFGHSSIGNLTFESAAYVARYVTKKITGKRAQAHYQTVDPASGEIRERLPERSICVSRRPGIGRGWYEKFGSFSRAHDFVVFDSKKMRPPKYYDRLFDLADPVLFSKVKRIRKRSGDSSRVKLEAQDIRNRLLAQKERGLSPLQYVYVRDRLSVMEDCVEWKFKQLKRGFEDG